VNLKEKLLAIIATLQEAASNTDFDALPVTVKPLAEAANVGEWLESRLHLELTKIADTMFGEGALTREERITLSRAIGDALDSYHAAVLAGAPQLFQRSPWKETPSNPLPMTESGAESEDIALVEASIGGEFVPLTESVLRSDGTTAIKVIKPGWGSSGYYSSSLLERDGASAFPAGTKMFWNHPTATEEAQRPERDLRDLAAVLTSDARWQTQGVDGPGLYADARVVEGYQKAVGDLAPHIGVSIRALGKARTGEAEGRKGRIIEALVKGQSIDFVTEPGAGGKILQLFEAARPGQPDDEPEITEAEQMEVQELQNEIARLKEANARLQAAQLVNEAKAHIEGLLATMEVPAATKARLVQQLSTNPPVLECVLNQAALTEAVKNAVTEEMTYLREVNGNTGQIRGMGSRQELGGAAVEAATVEKRLKEAFAALGIAGQEA